MSMITEIFANLLKFIGALLMMGVIALAAVVTIYAIVVFITYIVKLIFYPHMLNNNCDLTATQSHQQSHQQSHNHTSGEVSFSTKPLEDEFPESKFKIHDVVHVCEIEVTTVPSDVVHISYPKISQIVKINKKHIDTSIEPLTIVGIRRVIGFVGLQNVEQPIHYDGFAYTLTTGNQFIEEVLIKENDPLAEDLLKASTEPGTLQC